MEMALKLSTNIGFNSIPMGGEVEESARKMFNSMHSFSPGSPLYDYLGTKKGKKIFGDFDDEISSSSPVGLGQIFFGKGKRYEPYLGVPNDVTLSPGGVIKANQDATDRSMFTVKLNNAQKRITESNEKNFNGQYRLVYRLRSLVHREFANMYHLWYPPEKGYVKVIPKSIEISPLTLLHWYMDDGSLNILRKGSITPQYNVIFCTECFSKEDQQFLIDRFWDVYDIKARLVKRKWEWNGVKKESFRIKICQKSSRSFFDIIGRW